MNFFKRIFEIESVAFMNHFVILCTNQNKIKKTTRVRGPYLQNKKFHEK